MSPVLVHTTIYGLGENREFTLCEVEGAVGLYTLASVSGSEVRLMVLDAAVHLPAYAPVLDNEADEGGRLLVIVNTAAGSVTVNLAAPLVVRDGTCRQIIVEGDFSIQTPL